jgi:hypothetical protein
VTLPFTGLINYSELNVPVFLFADDLKMFLRIISTVDCLLLLSDVNSVQTWCAANHMKLNSGKTKVIFSRKSSLLPFNYILCNAGILRTECIKFFAVLTLNCSLLSSACVLLIFSRTKVVGSNENYYFLLFFSRYDFVALHQHSQKET